MDHQTRLFLQQLNSTDEPELETVSIEEKRRSITQSLAPSSIQSLSIADIKIPSSETQIPLRIYTPRVAKDLSLFMSRSTEAGGYLATLIRTTLFVEILPSKLKWLLFQSITV